MIGLDFTIRLIQQACRHFRYLLIVATSVSHDFTPRKPFWLHHRQSADLITTHKPPHWFRSSECL